MEDEWKMMAQIRMCNVISIILIMFYSIIFLGKITAIKFFIVYHAFILYITYIYIKRFLSVNLFFCKNLNNKILGLSSCKY